MPSQQGAPRFPTPVLPGGCLCPTQAQKGALDILLHLWLPGRGQTPKATPGGHVDADHSPESLGGWAPAGLPGHARAVTGTVTGLLRDLSAAPPDWNSHTAQIFRGLPLTNRLCSVIETGS